MSTKGDNNDWSNEAADMRDRDVDPRLRPVKRELSSEEMQILKDFRTDSFWYKCVPLTGFNCILLLFATRRGHVKKHPRVGYLFPYMGAIAGGYIGGKIWAFPEFREKILKLREGAIVDEFREGKTGIDLLKPGGDNNTPDQSSPVHRSGDDFKAYDPGATKASSFTNYEDIRNQNRSEFELSQSPSTLPTSQTSRQSRSSPDYTSKAKPKTNQYGDIVEE